MGTEGWGEIGGRTNGLSHASEDDEDVGPNGERYMHNPPAVGAPRNARWGYLKCGCTNDGFGRHLR